MEERRRVPRHKSLLRGRIYYNNRNSSADCLVRDISAHGARLIFADEMPIPEQLELYIPHRGQSYRAHVVWQRSGEAGIVFAVPNQTHPGEIDELAMRVVRLEHEIEALKRMLKRLRVESPYSDTEAA
ncbi:MAG TPA: PilZ domain-containing protein [Xanthobacteraceae bacterium]|nr:PilZ domain-containing protein [Xanthobacteraceae bacterium]